MLPRLTLLVGLALGASPVLSQDFIDLEAERKANAGAEVIQNPLPLNPLRLPQRLRFLLQQLLNKAVKTWVS